MFKSSTLALQKDTEAFILEAHFLFLPLITESQHGNLCCISYFQAKNENSKIPQNNRHKYLGQICCGIKCYGETGLYNFVQVCITFLS